MDEKKRCPYCGEEILAIAIKCKHCGSSIDAPSSTVMKQLKTRTPFKILGVLVLIVFAAPVIYNLLNDRSPFGAPSFDEAEIEHVKQSIRSEYGKREGITVVDIQLMKESPKTLSGFIKVKVPLFGDVTKPCSATMGEGDQYIWECQ
jgi:hypothetical protein